MSTKSKIYGVSTTGHSDGVPEHIDPHYEKTEKVNYGERVWDSIDDVCKCGAHVVVNPGHPGKVPSIKWNRKFEIVECPCCRRG